MMQGPHVSGSFSSFHTPFSIRLLSLISLLPATNPYKARIKTEEIASASKNRENGLRLIADACVVYY